MFILNIYSSKNYKYHFSFWDNSYVESFNRNTGDFL